MGLVSYSNWCNADMDNMAILVERCLNTPNALSNIDTMVKGFILEFLTQYKENLVKRGIGPSLTVDELIEKAKKVGALALD